MSNQLLFFLIVLVQNIVITIYVDTVFNYKKGRKVTNIIVYIFSNILFIATTPIINLKTLKLIIIMVLQVLFFKMISTNTWKEVIKKELIMVGLTLGSEFICHPIYIAISMFNNSRLNVDAAATFDTLRVLSAALALPFSMSSVLIYATFYKKIKKSIRRKIILVLLLIPISLIFIHYILYSYNIETFTFTTLLFLLITTCLFTFISFAVYHLILSVEKYVQKEKELEFLKQKEQMQLEYYKLMQNKEEEIRKINHDIKNNIQVIYALKNEKDKDKLVKQIDANLKRYELIKYSKNAIQNIILNTKVAEAKSKNIEISIDLKANIDFLNELDMSNMLSNILNNAIENTMYSKEKRIEFSIHKKMNYCVIKCSNTFDGLVNVGPSKKISSRKDGNHGYGLKIIGGIIEKYHGKKTINYDENQFTITVFIPEEEN